MAKSQKTMILPGIDVSKQDDIKKLTDKIVKLPPDAINYIAGAVEMAALLHQNKGA